MTGVPWSYYISTAPIHFHAVGVGISLISFYLTTSEIKAKKD
jgi:hypothetical protein